MRWRLAFLAAVALGLAPGTFVRTPAPVHDDRPILTLEPIDVDRVTRGEVTVEGLWELSSPNSNFGSYSGLVAISPGELLAVGDAGGWLRFAPPDGEGSPPRFGALRKANLRRKSAVDAEAVDYDPASGQVWVAYEVTNLVERSGLDFANVKSVQPDAMSNWPITSGPESMARLSDGRFIVIGEGSPDWLGDGYPGLLFDGDPIDGADVLRFGFDPPDGFRATDLATLTDGRVLILMRKIEGIFPPAFATMIALADPREIREGETWESREIATLGTDLPHDNFEGIAAVARADGSFTLWIISDDNGAALQESLLYKLHWTPSTP